MKILIVLPRFPYPLEKGDKLRAYNQVRSLSEHNDIYLFCLSHSRVPQAHIDALKPYCKAIEIARITKLEAYIGAFVNLVSVRSIQVGYWTSLRSKKKFQAFEQKCQPDVIYSQMVRTMPLVVHSTTPKVMDFQDALSMNMERRMLATRRGLKRLAWLYECKMLRSIEYNAFKFFDELTIISEPDCDAIPHKRNKEIHIVPNGVDFDYFRPLTAKKEYDIVFCGNMQYEPNINAVLFLAKKVMPLVWQQRPQTSLLIAGATPVKAVRALNGEHIKVSGSISDIRPCYASARIFAAPMQTGSGLQNKLLEAMSMEIPCVTTSIANASLHAEAGKEILVADKPQEIADYIVDLLTNEQLCASLTKAASAFVHEKYSWKSNCMTLQTILTDASNTHL